MKNTLSWFVSVMVALSVALFQFIMGITDPLPVKVNTGEQSIRCNLIRTYIGNSDCPVILPMGDITVSGYLLYRAYPSNNEMSKVVFNREGDKLVTALPHQPPSKKLEYKIVLEREGKSINVNAGNPVIMTFLGKVPLYLLALQSLLVLFTLILVSWSAILAVSGDKTYRGLIYLIFLLLAGIVLFVQPLIHNYSLNKWWTSMPVSWELGDNKLLIALIIWLIIAYYNFKRGRPALVIISSIITVILFSIPHGFPGVQRDHVTLELFTRKLVPLIQLF